MFYIDYGDGSRKKINEDELHLRNYCCHKLYAEALGNYYCGSDIGVFEKKFFGDRLPAKGTQKRKKWDEVASTFVEEAKTITSRYLNGKKFFDFLKSFTEGYQPLDLSRVKENTRSKNTPNQEKKEQTSSQRLNESKKRITEQEKQREQDKYTRAKGRKDVVGSLSTEPDKRFVVDKVQQEKYKRAKGQKESINQDNSSLDAVLRKRYEDLHKR